MKNKLIALCALAVFTFAACKKNEKSLLNTKVNNGNSTDLQTTDAPPPPGYCPITAGVICNDGLLSFADAESFIQVAEDIQKKYDDSANEDSTDTEVSPKCFEANFTYTSLRSLIYAAHLTALNNVNYEPADDLYFKYFPHTGLRTVCNSQGEVKVGPKLYIYTSYGDEFVVHNGDRSYTAQINAHDFANLDGVTRHAFDGSVYDYNNGTAIVTSTLGDCKPWTRTATKNYGGNKKLVMNVWVGNTTFLNTSGSDVRAFRRVWGAWVPNWTSSLYVEYGGVIHNKFCYDLAALTGNQSPTWAHYRRAANDVFTSNGWANNVFRTVKNGGFAGGASASGCSYFNAYLW